MLGLRLCGANRAPAPLCCASAGALARANTSTKEKNLVRVIDTSTAADLYNPVGDVQFCLDWILSPSRRSARLPSIKSLSSKLPRVFGTLDSSSREIVRIEAATAGALLPAVPSR